MATPPIHFKLMTLHSFLVRSLELQVSVRFMTQMFGYHSSDTKTEPICAVCHDTFISIWYMDIIIIITIIMLLLRNFSSVKSVLESI